MPGHLLSVVFENDAGQLLEHPAGYISVRYFRQKRGPADLPALVTELGRRLLLRGWHCILGDSRALPVLSEAEKTWLATNWMGRQIPRPPRLWVASVLPVDVFARLSVGQVQHGTAPENITYKLFTDPELAHEWLVRMAG